MGLQCLVLFIFVYTTGGSIREVSGRLHSEFHNINLLANIFSGSDPSESKFPEFHYTGPLGPHAWPKLYPSCAGGKQSPIFIDQYNSQPALMGTFSFTNFDVPPSEVTVTNNGHTVMITTPDRATVSGGNLPGDFQFLNFHFHWGSDNSRGSEHILDGFRYPLEAHIVFWNLKYPSSNEAMNQKDGIVVFAVLFELGFYDNHRMEPLIQALNRVIKKATSITISKPVMCLADVLPLNTHSYYRYFGSLTTPECLESVTWTVFRHTRHMSQRQLEEFRKILDIDNNPRENNFRPIQPLNSRVIYRNGIH